MVIIAVCTWVQNMPKTFLSNHWEEIAEPVQLQAGELHRPNFLINPAYCRGAKAVNGFIMENNPDISLLYSGKWLFMAAGSLSFLNSKICFLLVYFGRSGVYLQPAPARAELLHEGTQHLWEVSANPRFVPPVGVIIKFVWGRKLTLHILIFWLARLWGNRTSKLFVPSWERILMDGCFAFPVLRFGGCTFSKQINSASLGDLTVHFLNSWAR